MSVANADKQEYLGFYTQPQGDESVAERFDSLCRCIDLFSRDTCHRAGKYGLLMLVLNRACKFDLSIRATQRQLGKGDIGTQCEGLILQYHSEAMRLSGRSAALLCDIDARLPLRTRPNRIRAPTWLPAHLARPCSNDQACPAVPWIPCSKVTATPVLSAKGRACRAGQVEAERGSARVPAAVLRWRRGVLEFG